MKDIGLKKEIFLPLEPNNHPRGILEVTFCARTMLPMRIQAANGEYDKLLTLVKKRKLKWSGRVSRSSCLAKTILQGTVKG